LIPSLLAELDAITFSDPLDSLRTLAITLSATFVSVLATFYFLPITYYYAPPTLSPELLSSWHSTVNYFIVALILAAFLGIGGYTGFVARAVVFLRRYGKFFHNKELDIAALLFPVPFLGLISPVLVLIGVRKNRGWGKVEIGLN
jgi:hypothetical protein